MFIEVAIFYEIPLGKLALLNMTRGSILYIEKKPMLMGRAMLEYKCEKGTAIRLTARMVTF